MIKKIDADTYVDQALQGFIKDPPSTDYQRGYQRALKDVKARA